MTRTGSRRKPAPKAAADDSRGFWARLRPGIPLAGPDLAVFLLALTGGLALVVADFLTLFSVEVAQATCEDLAEPDLADACVTSGGEHHGYALVLIGLLVAAMGYGAARGRSRPAGLAVLALGVAAMAIALIVDRPDVYSVGRIGVNFEEAEAFPGIGFWLELVGAGLAILAGTVRLTRSGGPQRPKVPRARR